MGISTTAAAIGVILAGGRLIAATSAVAAVQSPQDVAHLTDANFTLRLH